MPLIYEVAFVFLVAFGMGGITDGGQIPVRKHHSPISLSGGF